MYQSSQVQVRWGQWFTEGWNMFAERWQVWVAQTLILLAATVLPFMVMYFGFIAVLVASSNGDRPPEPPPAFIVLFLGFYLVIILAAAFISAGMHHTAFRQLRGEEVRVTDVFRGGPYFLKIIVMYLLFSLAMMIIITPVMIVSALLLPLLILVIPAMFVVSFLAQGLMYFASSLIVERGYGPVQALSESFSILRPQMWMFGAFAFVLNLMATAGMYACGVGMLITWPLWYTITAVAYRDCLGVTRARTFFGQQQMYPQPGEPSSQGYYPPPPSAPAPPPPQQSAGAFCTRCGYQNAENPRFCLRCGTPLQI